MRAPLYLALVHHPINNKRGEVVTTSVTNLDIHDISRSCKTFGVSQYFLVTPLEAQHQLVSRILGHWESDTASAYNPDRQEALEVACLVHSLQDACDAIQRKHGVPPVKVATGANFKTYHGDAYQLGKRMRVDERPYLLIFGTGWGLHATIVEQADYCLRPIGHEGSEYNHLSVRSAVAIYLDRLSSGL